MIKSAFSIAMVLVLVAGICILFLYGTKGKKLPGDNSDYGNFYISTDKKPGDTIWLCGNAYIILKK